MIRINPMNQRYLLQEINEDVTKISLQGTAKSIVVNHSIADLSAMWYKWQMQGEYIQNAFRDLTAGEREFLMTGITPDEWDKLFSTEEYK